jgi:hypothetical protein
MVPRLPPLSAISFCASERPPVPQSMTTRVPRAERTSTQDVLPPYRRVSGPGVAMDPRVPQNCIRTVGLRVLHSCVSPSLHKALARKTFPATVADHGWVVGGSARAAARVNCLPGFLRSARVFAHPCSSFVGARHVSPLFRRTTAWTQGDACVPTKGPVWAPHRGGFETRPYNTLACGSLGARLCLRQRAGRSGEIRRKA